MSSIDLLYTQVTNKCLNYQLLHHMSIIKAPLQPTMVILQPLLSQFLARFFSAPLRGHLLENMQQSSKQRRPDVPTVAARLRFARPIFREDWMPGHHYGFMAAENATLINV